MKNWSRGRLERHQLEEAVPGVEWNQLSPTNPWWRSWRGNDPGDIEVAVLFPTRAEPHWRVGLAWGKQGVFPELRLLFPETAPDANGNRLVAHFPDSQAVLQALARYHRELAESDVDVTRPPRLRTEDPGWAWKTAILLKQAVADPTGLGPDLEKVDARLWADAHDGLFAVGRSAAAAAAGLRWGTPGAWREHTVPCNAVRDQALRRAAAGVTTTELADFLLAHLRVVLLTEEEARKLDGMRTGSGANLRDNMPDGWQWGGDPFARLRFAGVVLE